MRKCVEHALTVTKRHNRFTVILLIEKKTGLLAFCDIDIKEDAVFIYRNHVAAASVYPARPFFEPFFFADGGIAPLVYTLRIARFNKSCRNFFAENFTRERKELNDKIHGTLDGCKSFDDETGKQIGFGKNETVRIEFSVTDAPHIRRIADARIDKRFRIFKHFVRMSRREHAHAYLRFSVDNARTDKSACSRKHFARASVGTFAFGKRRIFSAAPVGCKVFYMRDFVVEYPRKALYDFPFFFRF